MCDEVLWPLRPPVCRADRTEPLLTLGIFRHALWEFPECLLTALPSPLSCQPHAVWGRKQTPLSAASLLLLQTRGRGLHVSYCGKLPALSKLAATGALPWALPGPLGPHGIRQPFLTPTVFQGHPSSTEDTCKVSLSSHFSNSFSVISRRREERHHYFLLF